MTELLEGKTAIIYGGGGGIGGRCGSDLRPRAPKAFYVEKAGFNLDVDHRARKEFCVVRLTPPGSACSITIGKGITDAAPGSVRGTHLGASDIEAARAELVARGVEVSEVRHLEPGGWVPGPDPELRDHSSFADFSDSDGNTCVLQEARRGEPGA